MLKTISLAGRNFSFSSQRKLLSLYRVDCLFRGRGPTFLDLPRMSYTHLSSLVQVGALSTASNWIHLQCLWSWCERRDLSKNHVGLWSDFFPKLLWSKHMWKSYVLPTSWINELYSSPTPVFTKMSWAPGKVVKPHLTHDVKFNLLWGKQALWICWIIDSHTSFYGNHRPGGFPGCIYSWKYLSFFHCSAWTLEHNSFL